jgi:hypothetical protein
LGFLGTHSFRWFVQSTEAKNCLGRQPLSDTLPGVWVRIGSRLWPGLTAWNNCVTRRAGCCGNAAFVVVEARFWPQNSRQAAKLHRFQFSAPGTFGSRLVTSKAITRSMCHPSCARPTIATRGLCAIHRIKRSLATSLSTACSSVLVESRKNYFLQLRKSILARERGR